MTLHDLHTLSPGEAASLLSGACGSSTWLNRLMEYFPFTSLQEMLRASEKIWYQDCGEPDWLEAFSHHPKIGDIKSLAEKFASTSHLAGKEQAAVAEASEDLLVKLARANEEYEAKNGFIFIVCATGKSAQEMLHILEGRLRNTRDEELFVAMGEQHKITLLRLRKILQDEDWSFLKPSQITTHVLDTSLGLPGRNIRIRMKARFEDGWRTIAQGETNQDGRIPDLLPPGRVLPPGSYQMVFDTGRYFYDQAIRGFYPEVAIEFLVTDDTHYHVPLLINPFGYSTYRGT